MQIICESHTIHIPWRGEERGGEERRGEERRGGNGRGEKRRGGENRRRNKKTKQTITITGKTHMTNKSVTAIKNETLKEDEGNENNNEGNHTMSRT